MDKLTCELPDLSDYFCDRDVPVFHDGDEGQYDRADLEEIAANTNARQETCDLPAITLGHLRDDLPEHLQPPVVGFAKNFRVVEFANRPTIIADLHIHKDHAEEARKYPRRSAEIWVDGKYIDPIALLGASTPARDLSLLFNKSGKKVYGKVCPCCEMTAKNVRRTNRYDKETRDIMDTNEIVKDVLDALKSTGLMEALEWCKGKMDEENQHLDEDEHDDDSEQFAEEEQSEKDRADERLGEEAHDDEAKAEDDEEAEGDEREKDKESFAQARRNLVRYQKAYADLEKRLADMERKNRRAERKSELLALEQEGYEFDMAEELSAVEEMPVQQYGKHVSRIRKCYRKAPIGSTIRVAQPNSKEADTFSYEESCKAADLVLSKKAQNIQDAFMMLRGGNS